MCTHAHTLSASLPLHSLYPLHTFVVRWFTLFFILWPTSLLFWSSSHSIIFSFCSFHFLCSSTLFFFSLTSLVSVSLLSFSCIHFTSLSLFFFIPLCLPLRLTPSFHFFSVHLTFLLPSCYLQLFFPLPPDPITYFKNIQASLEPGSTLALTTLLSERILLYRLWRGRYFLFICKSLYKEFGGDPKILLELSASDRLTLTLRIRCQVHLTGVCICFSFFCFCLLLLAWEFQLS